MRQISLGLILLIVIVGGCKKSSNGNENIATSSTPVATAPAVPPPTANFKIKNALSPTSVWELLPLNIENSSKDADSYLWDFGDGVTSTDKTPTNIALGPCATTRTITLTVKNKSGQAVSSASYVIICSRGMGLGAHEDKKP
jgi:PKD repeat protein